MAKETHFNELSITGLEQLLRHPWAVFALSELVVVAFLYDAALV